MTELLTIKEAATYLNVSEMSLRRWTNAGKLNCLRVGRKKERRFREEDLKSYLFGDTASTNCTSKIPNDSHIAHFYKSQDEGIQTSLACVKNALDRGELVALVTPPQKGKILKNKLYELGIIVDVLEAQNILTISGGCSSPADQIDFIDQLTEIAKNFNGFSLVEDISWTRDKNWGAHILHKFEKLTDNQRKQLQGKFICQYDLKEFSRDEAFLAMQTHNYTIYNGKLNKSSYYELAPKWGPNHNNKTIGGF